MTAAHYLPVRVSDDRVATKAQKALLSEMVSSQSSSLIPSPHPDRTFRPFCLVRQFPEPRVLIGCNIFYLIRSQLGQAWWHMTVIPALERQRRGPPRVHSDLSQERMNN